MRRVFLFGAYHLSFVLFGLGAFGFNLVCALLLLAPCRKRISPLVRRAIRRLFGLWAWWLNFCGVVRVDYHGFARPIAGARVVVANHPTLIDAPLLLARMPDAMCVFKSSLLRNPAIGPAARLAGYVAGDAGVDTVRALAAAVAAGRPLLIFPEGTRTAVGAKPGRFKAGFALVAARARAPVTLVVVRATPGLVARDRPWWKHPEPLPAFVSLTHDREWEHDPRNDPSTLTAAIEHRLHEVLG